MSKYCASTIDEGTGYFQAGDRKFECTNDDLVACYNDFYEYCGDTVPEDEPEEPTDPEEEEVPEECELYMYCEGGDFNIYRCTPEDEDIYIYYSGFRYDCQDPVDDMERCDSELEMFSESCNN